MLPNNSPAPSESSEQFNNSPPPSPKYLNTDEMMQCLPTALSNMKRSIDKVTRLEEGVPERVVTTTTSGIESEMTATTTDSEPPKKIYISEDGNGERVVTGRSPKHKTEYGHKARSPKHSAPTFRVTGPNEKGK